MEGGTIKTTALGQADYPKLLAKIYDPPKVLYYRGDLSICDQPTLAVVGSRKFSPYGQQACQHIVGPLARQGMVIVSGLALGIDGISHQTALDNQGKTIAVLGSGVDDNSIFPVTNRHLARKIIENKNLIISEFPCGFRPTSYSFPTRNRIIAGLSLGTLIIEAAEKSGALITASCALDYNREVFAVPNPIFSPTSAGVNNLIKNGAFPVTLPADITKILNIQDIKQTMIVRQLIPASKQEEAIYKILSKEPKHIDLIIKQTNLDSHIVNGTLTLMEIKGLVKNVGNMMYINNNLSI